MQTKSGVLIVSCVALLMLTEGTAQAQRRGFGAGTIETFQVATVPEVAQELKLSQEQTALAQKLNEEDQEQRRTLFQDSQNLTQEQRREKTQQLQAQRTERTQQLAKLVGEEKAKRLRQLALQAAGLVQALNDREVAQQLSITPDQRTQIREAGQGLGERLREARGDREAQAKIRKEIEDKVTAVLTAEQKTKFKELTGEPAGEELLEKIRAATSPRRRRNAA